MSPLLAWSLAGVAVLDLAPALVALGDAARRHRRGEDTSNWWIASIVAAAFGLGGLVALAYARSTGSLRPSTTRARRLMRLRALPARVRGALPEQRAAWRLARELSARPVSGVIDLH